MKDSRFEAIKKVKKKIERELIADENIVSIGTVKETNKLGQETGDYIIQIGLLSKKDKASIDHLQIKVQALLEEFGASLKPLSGGQIKINFVEEGEIHPLNRFKLPSADDSVILLSGENKYHSRPIISGFSVRHEKITAGTRGGMVKQHPVGLLFAGSAGKTYCNHLSAVGASMNQAGFFNRRFAKGKRGYSTVAHRSLIKPTSMTSLGKPMTQLLRMAFK